MAPRPLSPETPQPTSGALKPQSDSRTGAPTQEAPPIDFPSCALIT